MNKLILYGVGIPLLAAGCASTQNFSTADSLEARMRGAPQISLEIDLNNPERICEDFDMPEFLGTDKNETVMDINYGVDVDVSCIDGVLRKLEVKDQHTGKTVRLENYDSNFELHGLSATYKKADGAVVSEKIHEHGRLIVEKTWHGSNDKLATDKVYSKETGKILLKRELNEDGVETLLKKYNAQGTEIYKLTRHSNGKKATEDRWDDNQSPDGDSFVWGKQGNMLSHYQYKHGVDVGTQTEWYAGTTTKKRQTVFNEQGKLEYHKSWHRDGSLKEDKPFTNGVPVGTHWEYFIGGKGNPKHKNPFDFQGLQHGEETIWKQGKEQLDLREIFEVYRHHGKKMGFEVSTDQDGVTTKTHYVNDVQDRSAEIIEANDTVRP